MSDPSQVSTERQPDVVFTSEAEVYSCRVIVSRESAVCMVCNKTTDCLIVDTSDGEYLSFDCCGPCFSHLLGS